MESSFQKIINQKIQSRIDLGERLSAFTQFGAMLFFVLLWYLAPKAQDSTQQFEVIPTVMMYYFPLIALRIILAFKNKINYWISAIYTFIDTTAILSIIFLYHIQYNSPPALSLKSPSFLLLLLVIALRTLSFRASIVLLATIMTSFGWISLVVYTLNDRRTLITRNFVEYVSSFNVLVGAEIEKIIVLVCIGLVLTIAVKMTYQLLIDATAALEKTRNFSLFFSPDVSDMIQKGQIQIIPGKGEKRLAAILFVDLRSFTTITQKLEPDEVMSILSEYHKIVVPIIQKNKGTVDKFMGDGIFAHFGAAYQTETFAADALNTAEEINLAIKKWNLNRLENNKFEIFVNMALAEGPLIFGATGDNSRLEITAIGDSVNFTAKLEKHNKQLGACLSTTGKLIGTARDQGFISKNNYICAQNQTIAGVEKSVDIYYLPMN